MSLFVVAVAVVVVVVVVAVVVVVVYSVFPSPDLSQVLGWTVPASLLTDS